MKNEFRDSVAISAVCPAGTKLNFVKFSPFHLRCSSRFVSPVRVLVVVDPIGWSPPERKKRSLVEEVESVHSKTEWTQHRLNR